MINNEILNNITIKYQRELNRIQDNDRNVRKRGLQKLYEDINAYNNKNQIEFLYYLYNNYINNNLLIRIVTTDILEKCREFSIKLLNLCINICQINLLSTNSENITTIISLVQSLCSRITIANVGESFPEPAEELRLQIIEILILLVNNTTVHDINNQLIPNEAITSIVIAISKSLHDLFPEVKRKSAELLCIICRLSPDTVRLHFKSLLKGISVNAVHQHAKIRVITIKSLGLCIACIKEEYENVMKEPIIPLLLRLSNDKIPKIRQELADLCHTALTSRSNYITSLCKEDLNSIVILLLLYKDDIYTIANSSLSHLNSISKLFLFIYLINENKMITNDVDDGEIELNKPIKDEAFNNGYSTILDDINKLSNDVIIKKFLLYHDNQILSLFYEGIENWSIEFRLKYLRGLDGFLSFIQDKISVHLPSLLAYLSIPIRDEDNSIRIVSESICVTIGMHVPPTDVLDLLIPRVRGEISGSDTTSHRTNAVRLLTHIIIGISKQEDLNCTSIVETITNTLGHTNLYEYRETPLRESIILLVRALIKSYPVDCKIHHIQNNLTLALIYLQARLPSENDSIVSEASKSELFNLSKSSIFFDNIEDRSDAAICEFLTAHFDYIINKICPSAVSTYQWTPSDISKAAFEVLITQCPKKSWSNYERILDIITPQVQPKSGPTPGSTESNMANYAAIRGEERIPNITEIDMRLSLIALIEGMIRAGSLDWECGQYLTKAAEPIIKNIVIPNLIWKVGRVEATIRKVTLAAVYALLRAGSIKSDILASVAPDLVPLLVSHLEDSEVTPRHMASLCLTVIFERLRGFFAEQTIYELYPKIIKRLDDSHDEVRLSICQTLQMFLQCAPKSCYSGTTIEYILDQLFIHLDDNDNNIQTAVYNTILTCSIIDVETVKKKANKNLSSNRSSHLIVKLLENLN